MLKFTNTEKTSATFNGASFNLSAPENWASIGDVPTRDAVLGWLSLGNSPEPVDPPVVSIPSVVSKFQAKAALLDDGLLSTVETIMADPSTPAIYKLAWTEATEFKRDSPTVAVLAGLLGLSSDDLDALFTKASGISA